jgi:hypothetical protein
MSHSSVKMIKTKTTCSFALIGRFSLPTYSWGTQLLMDVVAALQA